MKKVGVLLVGLALCIMLGGNYVQAAIAEGSAALAGCPVGMDVNREVMLQEFSDGITAYQAKDLAKALPLIKAAAEAGNPNAQYQLAIMYDYGRGLPVNHEKTNVWYLKAAQQGNDDAQFNLGISYQIGEGIGQDMKMSACWVAQAALNGDNDALGTLNKYATDNPDSQYVLAAIYRDGVRLHNDLKLYPHEEDNMEIQPDPEKYKFWLEKAAANQQPDALKELGK